MAQSNLATRLLTALVLAPPLLWVLFRGPVWGWFAIVLTATAIGAQELFAMTHPDDRPSQVVGVVTSVAACAGVYFGAADARILVTTFIAVTLVGLLVPLWRLGDISSAGLRIMAGIASPLYVGGLLATIALLRHDRGADGASWVLGALFFSWLGDTGGYFFGRFLGKTKLYEAVSPKKTRAGFVGSLVGAATGALILHLFFLPRVPLAELLALAVVSGALGQLGDLVESLLKRSTGIKDSGTVIPGHGGILDRIDALLVVSALVYVYTLWRVEPG